jgi:hypothetical protein
VADAARQAKLNTYATCSVIFCMLATVGGAAAGEILVQAVGYVCKWHQAM